MVVPQKGGIRDEWQRVRVSAVASAVIGGTPSRRVAEYWRGTIPWVTAKDIANTSGRYVEQAHEYITEKGLKSSSAKRMPEGTVIITARGTVGALAQLRQDMAFNQTCYALVPHDGLDNDFLFYALKGTADAMRALSYGTVFETITTRTFSQWQIPLPPLPEQRAIAHLLGTLDDKIALNRRMNATLDEMARALFTSWFVHFDPVHAKAALTQRASPGGSAWLVARAYLDRLEPALAALFPDRFVDSELGPIPARWTVKPLGDLIELRYGQALKAANRRAGPVPVYGSNGRVGWHDEPLIAGPSIIVGRKGTPGTVTWAAGACFPIDTTFYVVPKDPPHSLPFLFYALQGQGLPAVAADSAVPGLNRHLASLNLQVTPPAPVVAHFVDQVESFFARRHSLEEESRTLTALRDTLLPKLLSGQIRVHAGSPPA